ncbi:YwbE family protein [Candidatus Nitrosocosmicus hydrocola]|uniref:YwbE family protein n=1 Tax=Candidatus Nitrosocosmicus hydrocola TaxID=1826872 RepID=UPI0011E5CE6C|nr:YwbE family protein [Candidatus Nitrosocosmicus hydrocola]
MNGNSIQNIMIGSVVRVVQKNDQKTGKLTEGTVKEILTRSKTHPHGIKVVLENGMVGRVKELVR